MEEPRSQVPVTVDLAHPTGPSRDLALVLALVAFSAAIHAWLICHTEVTARDSIGFIRHAWELRHHPWREVLQDNPHPPLYPLTVLGMSSLVGRLAPGTELETMQLGVQLASSLAAVLLVIPTYFLGRNLFNPRVGFWAAVLFQCLPVGARVLADGLSDPLYLLFITTGLLLAERTFRTNSLPRFIGCGIFSGLAYLTRPEGVLLLGASGLVLFGMQMVPGWRRPWKKTFVLATGMTAAALVISVPYMTVIGGFSNKTTTKQILSVTHAETCPARPGPMRGPLLAVWLDGYENARWLRRLGWSLKAVGLEVVRGFYYVAWVPALLGLWWCWDPFRKTPGAWVMLVLCLAQVLVLCRVAMVAGYVADRHVLILVLCGLFGAVAAMQELPRKLSELSGRPGWAEISWLPAVFLLGLILASLPKTLQPLHTNRAGHHAAGLWLADHAKLNEYIVDPYCWAKHYAGRTFMDDANQTDLSAPEYHFYIVRERRPDRREHAHLPTIPEKEIIASGGKIVYHWPEQQSEEKADVVVYRVPLPDSNEDGPAKTQ